MLTLFSALHPLLNHLVDRIHMVETVMIRATCNPDTVVDLPTSFPATLINLPVSKVQLRL